MGTNYYLHLEDKPKCESCGRETEPLHIGKSSYGWVFSLHVIPEKGINSLQDWEKLWNSKGAKIQDEYSDDISPEEMKQSITNRCMEESLEHKKWGGNEFCSYDSEEQFHQSNNSMRGPNNLVRSKLDSPCSMQ